MERSPLSPDVLDHSNLVEAKEFARKAIGRELRAAREAAGLIQTELARKLKISETLVSAAELGTVHIASTYAEKVLKACGLPMDWKAASDGNSSN